MVNRVTRKSRGGKRVVSRKNKKASTRKNKRMVGG